MGFNLSQVGAALPRKNPQAAPISAMAERSFAEEVKQLRLGEGEVFRGEGILAAVSYTHLTLPTKRIV